jgi:glycogen synthase
MRASVVINTYNRAAFLGNAVRSIARQTFADIELVVVNGPSTDNTLEVLQALAADGMACKLAHCASRNLSESRNIGIAHSSGDVVLFIDDDGIAHPEWVERIMAAYASRRVGAVGGFTIDHTGIGYQCKYTVCDRRGNAHFLQLVDPTSLLDAVGSEFFPSLLGTNCSFRRSLLMEIGGFDEVFAYMLDETDVCLRVFERGHRVVTLPDALVVHKYAPSHSRSAERIPTSLLAPARSKAYFMLKHHRAGTHDAASVFQEIDAYKRDIEFSNRWYLDHNKITSAHYAKLMSELHEGIVEGLSRGLDASVKERISPHLAVPPEAFLPVVRGRPTPKRMTVYLVSQGYPPRDTSGIARWTHESAQALAALGHDVHVIARSHTDASHVDFIDSVWVHAVTDAFPDDMRMASPEEVPDSVARRASAVYAEIKRSLPIWGGDVVSAPIWDIEGLFCAAYLPIPVVTSLHTTYLLALPYKPEWQRNADYRIKHVERVVAGERWLLGHSAAVLANSKQIVQEIEASYGLRVGADKARVETVPHGVAEAPVPAHAPARSERPELLFVGRIERRKGPDMLLNALLALPRDAPDFDLTLVGASPPKSDEFVQEIDRLLARVQARFPRARVRLLGYVPEPELISLYAGCDIFVAPSRFESFGLILIEAMRFGKPVVACDVGGIPEVVDDGVEGYLVAAEDVATLGRRLATLIGSAQTRETMGANALQRFRRDFTGEVMGRSLERFFMSVIEKKPVHG